MSNQAKSRYEVLVANEYESTGQKKTRWTKVGVGFPNQDGKGLNLVIEPGLSVSGNLVVRLYEPKAQG